MIWGKPGLYAGRFFNEVNTEMIASDVEYGTWMCLICGYIYEEEKGDIDSGIAPGTRWADIPESWVCPECQMSKIDFEMVCI